MCLWPCPAPLLHNNLNFPHSAVSSWKVIFLCRIWQTVCILIVWQQSTSWLNICQPTLILSWAVTTQHPWLCFFVHMAIWHIRIIHNYFLSYGTLQPLLDGCLSVRWQGVPMEPPTQFFHTLLHALVQEDCFYRYVLRQKNNLKVSRRQFSVQCLVDLIMHVLSMQVWPNTCTCTRVTGPNLVSRKLVRAECVRCPWLQAETWVATINGIFSLSLSSSGSLLILPEGFVIGIQIFAWAPN